MSRRVLVTGASGFVGSALCCALVRDGHEVHAMTRRPEDYDGAGFAVAGDVDDPSSLAAPMEGMDAAYYLVHSLGSKDFERKDAAAARAFGAAAAAAGISQIVYLGGLGADSDNLSPHLRSRRTVETLLAADRVPVTVLRAAVVIGHGGISWEMTRQLVDHLPAMITPKWTFTRTQPIALRDVVRYLVGVLGNRDAIGRMFEVGGSDVLRYVDMLTRATTVMGKRQRPMIKVPLLSPKLSAHWLAFVTDVDHETASNLVESMSNEVVVRDDSIRDVLPGDVMGYDEAVRCALAEREHVPG